MTRKIDIVFYNPAWPKMFEEEAAKIKQVLGSHCLKIEHIGSTSVPGLSAKEDLDILCIVDDLSSSLPLQNMEYVFKGDLFPLRYFFSKNSPHSKVNLHVCEPDHGVIALLVCFRDYLRTHEDARLDYEALKYRLIRDPASFERLKSGFPRYTLEKDAFIKSILEKAGFSGIILDFCRHEREWEHYHRIRKVQIFDPINVVYDPHHPTLTMENHYHFILYRGTTIVSVAHVELLNEAEAALRSLASDEPFKNKGYGSHMMKLLEKWIKNKGRTVLKMHANLRAEPFYRKLGYVDMPFDDPCINPEFVNLGKVLKETKA